MSTTGGIVQTRKQKKREDIAKLCDQIAGTPNNESSKQIRTSNRRVEKRKRKQFNRSR